MPPREKVGTIATLIAIGLLGALVVKLPARTLSFHGASFVVTGQALLGLVLLGLTCAGVQNVIYGHPKGNAEGPVQSILHWILPVALLTVTFAFVVGPGSIERRAVGAGLGSMALGLLIIAEYYVTDPDARWHSAVQILLQFAAYLAALSLYTLLATHVPAGTRHLVGIAVLGMVLGLYLLAPDRRFLNVPLYIAALGAFLAIASWMLGKLWNGPALAYSLVLVVLLYVATGVARQHSLNKLTWSVALEYAVAGLVILALLLVYVH